MRKGGGGGMLKEKVQWKIGMRNAYHSMLRKNGDHTGYLVLLFCNLLALR
jgi:hypothetical protein